MSNPLESPQDASSAGAKFGLGSSISSAWLADSATSAHIEAFETAWDTLVERSEWRDWVRDHLVPVGPVLYLAVRDDLDRRRLLKTKNGVSAHVPVAEVHAAEQAGELIEFFAALISAIYAKWASCADCPAPPSLRSSSC